MVTLARLGLELTGKQTDGWTEGRVRSIAITDRENIVVTPN